MVNKSRVLSDMAVALEDAETIGSDRLQESQVARRVDIGMRRMSAEDARKPPSLATPPVPLETAIAALRRLPGILLLHADSLFLAVLPDTLLRGPVEPVRTSTGSAGAC